MLLVIIVLVLLASGCASPAPPPPLTVTPSSPAVTPPVSLATPATPSDSAITLTVWLPDTLENLAGRLNDFSTGYSATFNVRFKKASGSGGLLELLRTAAPVAPSALPDVVMLSLSDLQNAARLGVVQPLDSWLASGLTQDLFPFASLAGQVDGKWYGLPCAVDLEHLVYDSRHVTATMPLTWTAVLSQGLSYFVPMGSVGGVLPDAVLVQYLANGGTLTDARGQPRLDEAPLADTLLQFSEMYRAGLTPAEALRASSTEAAWQALAGRQALLANMRASQYLVVKNSAEWLSHAALPARSGPARPMARGWAWALTSRDPARQPRAAALIMWLMAADRQAILTRAAGLLPTRPSALDQWKQRDPYVAFLQQELGRAVAPPSAETMAVIGPVFQRALADVLAGKTTPQEAAAAATTQLKGGSP